MPTTSSVFVGVVPCAGASRRMGQPKALLDLAGRPFVHHVVRSLAEGGCDPVLVVVAEGDDDVAEAARSTGAHTLLNPDPGEGPITSLRLAITELDVEVRGIAYLPVDHPVVRPETVARLLTEARQSEAALTVPVYVAKRGHPAIFEARLFPELLDPSLEGGARIVVRRHLTDARLVEVDDPGVVTDVDSPEEYAALVSRPWHPRGERHL